MDMSRLQAFCLVVEKRSFTKAAKELYVTQPSISTKIKELEGYYKIKLLERNSNRIVPTESGKLLYEQGKKILLLADNIQKELERLNNKEEGEIFVGASSTIGNFALPCSIYLYKEKYPDITLTLSINNSTQIIDNILHHNIKIGLIEGPLSKDLKEKMLKEGLRVRKIINHELVLTAPNNDQWKDVTEISLDELKDVPLIMREKGSGIRRTIENTLEQQGVGLEDLNVILELDSINAIVSTITAENGVSFLPRMAVRKELHYRTLKKISIRNTKFSHPFILLYYPSEITNIHHNSFVELLMSKDRGFC